jgi:hypothetical protein
MNWRCAVDRIEPPAVGERHVALTYRADTVSEYPYAGRELARGEDWAGGRTSEDAHPVTRAFNSNPPAESVHADATHRLAGDPTAGAIRPAPHACPFALGNALDAGSTGGQTTYAGAIGDAAIESRGVSDHSQRLFYVVLIAGTTHASYADA